MVIGFLIAAILVLLVLGIINIHRKLKRMNENITGAMGQIGVQLSSRFEALLTLLEQMKSWKVPQAQALLNTVRSRRSPITADSLPDEVHRQEALLREVLCGVSAAADQSPAVKADAAYVKYMNALDCYGKMLSTSRLIYNDSVARLNRELRSFPTSLLKGFFSLKEKDYLVAAE